MLFRSAVEQSFTSAHQLTDAEGFNVGNLALEYSLKTRRLDFNRFISTLGLISAGHSVTCLRERLRTLGVPRRAS